MRCRASVSTARYGPRRAELGPQLADARRLGRGGDGRAPAPLPLRLPQLRHDLRAGLGTRTGAPGEPRLRRRIAADPPPTDGAVGTGDDSAGRRHADPDDGWRL